MLTSEERSIIAPPEDISTEEWGKAFRELSVLTSAAAGRWSIDQIPFLRPVLESLDDPDVEVTCLQKSTQIAGTETVLTWLGRIAHQDPGPAMVCLADEDTAGEICERRVQPMFLSAPPLNALIDPRRFGKQQITLKNAFSLVMAWASSIARTASRPIRFLVLDEICKPSYGQTQDEGSVISRIIQRTETFPNRKVCMLSTVTTEGDNMHKQMALCEAVYDWHVPCPMCGAFQPLRFSPRKYRTLSGDEAMSGRVAWEDKPTVRESAATAQYECGECRGLWTTAQKNAAVALGKAVPRDAVSGKPRRVGFHVSRLLSLFPGGRLGALAEAFLLAKNDPLELQSFVNNSLAEHWSDVIKAGDRDDVIAACLQDHRRQAVPEESVALVATIDVQKSGFWFVVRAWSRDLTSWLVDYGFLPDWELVENMLFENTYGAPVWRGLIDIGGGLRDGSDTSSTEEVELWLRRNGRGRGARVWGCKGSSTALAGKLSIGKPLDKTPSGKPLPGGLQIISLDTDKLKDAFWWRLGLAKERAIGAAYLPDDITEDYIRQILSEEKRRDKKGNEEWVRIHRDNHLFDCEMMQIAAVDPELFGGIRMLRQSAPPAIPEPKQIQDDTEKINPFTRRPRGENPYTRR